MARGDHQPDESTTRRMEPGEKSEGARDREFDIAECTCGDPDHEWIRSWPDGKWNSYRRHR